MDKNEILEKSRNENKNGGEYEIAAVKSAYRIAAAIGIIVCAVFYFIEQNITYFIIWFAMISAREIYRAIKLKTLTDAFCSAISLGLLCFLVARYLSDKGIY